MTEHRKRKHAHTYTQTPGTGYHQRVQLNTISSRARRGNSQEVWFTIKVSGLHHEAPQHCSSKKACSSPSAARSKRPALMAVQLTNLPPQDIISSALAPKLIVFGLARSSGFWQLFSLRPPGLCCATRFCHSQVATRFKY